MPENIGIWHTFGIHMQAKERGCQQKWQVHGGHDVQRWFGGYELNVKSRAPLYPPIAEEAPKKKFGEAEQFKNRIILMPLIDPYVWTAQVRKMEAARGQRT